MKIGNIVLKNNLILAPMAGVTDIAFRSICVDCGADYAVTEMVSVNALAYRNEKTFELLRTADNEKIKVVQLFGYDPKIFAKVVKMPELDKFDIIDINMGCPTPKIVNNGAGCSLMKDIDRARQIIEAVVASTSKPVTVKFRKGWDENTVNAVEFAKMCESAGARAITVHGRTREQFYSGVCDWDIVAEVKKAVSIPVILSGDIVDKSSYDRAVALTKCDGVMIGRGALGNPAIFSQILGTSVVDNTMDYVRRHVDILRQYYSDHIIVHYMRKHFLWYLKDYRNAKTIKVDIVKYEDLDEVLGVIENFINKASRK
ncbi:MAG: tRNA dihydrouridine synthase DusB [Clostridiales bacterium]|nr:tRNA dihydrouridine synthase DusB [Clostridiales bacterium]